MSDAKEHTQQGLIAESDRRINSRPAFKRMEEALMAIAFVCEDLKEQGKPLDHDSIRDVAKYGLDGNQ